MQRGHRSRDRRTDRRTNNFVSILSTRNDNGAAAAAAAGRTRRDLGADFGCRPVNVNPPALRTKVSSFTLSQEFDFSDRVRLHSAHLENGVFKRCGRSMNAVNTVFEDVPRCLAALLNQNVHQQPSLEMLLQFFTMTTRTIWQSSHS